MKRFLLCMLVALALLEAGRRLRSPSDEAAAAGTAAYRAGDYARAEARFRQAEQGATEPARAAHNHAAALYKLQRYDGADREYRRSTGDGLRDARAAYDRGNCALSQASRGDTADRALVARAAEQYEACLAHDGTANNAGTLFDDARHNLELAKLLLAEPPPPPEATAKDDPNPDEPGKEEPTKAEPTKAEASIPPKAPPQLKDEECEH
jgi:tetratricopeptide (TPR) repeat protein